MKLQTLSLIMVALLLTACGKQSSSKSGTRINKNTGSVAGLGTTTCNAQSWGQISSATSDAESFRRTVADFALYSPEEIGDVNLTSGIQIQMTLAFQNGQLVPNASRMGFRITDSFVGAPSPDGSTVRPIEFVMEGMQGNLVQNGFVAYIGDSKGYVKLEGRRTQNAYEGRVYYSNYNQAEQVLGNFMIQTCAVVGN